MGEEKEITITYETLFELLRREKTREELQKLNPTFFKDVVNYLREKQDMLKAQQDELFFADEKGKTQMQLQNIRKILTEIYDRREKKIFNLAMIRARTKGLIDVSALMEEEKRMYDSLVQLLEGYRGSILTQLLFGNMPLPLAARIPPPPAPLPPPPNIEAEPAMVPVRFTHQMPKFVGPRLEVYGPFEQDDTAELPEQIAKVLIERGRAEPAAEASAVVKI